MSGSTDPGSQWRQVSVIVRSDILLKATETGLDISDVLNSRLADIVGIDYRQLPPADRLLQDTAISTGSTAGNLDEKAKHRSRSPVLHPVINADDPAAATKVRKAKRQLPPEPDQVTPAPLVPVPVASPQPELAVPSEYPVLRSPRGGREKEGSRKKGKDEILKKFVSAMITRVDAADAKISKEEMYLAFARWCRDHRISPVPDRKNLATALKNRFAIAEKTIGGTSCWINIRLG